ncbi:hypothetical protein EVAR_102605_1 [Eumeta japonica]|uniref:Uncharacterized protein n=1 Tax=Eumeta variegata TaxID=151549 RepID=A0A4C1TUR3_EUMVA|nr:hypothetical protein EVAR_102605_1 [Eumeta japonica]
MEFETFLCFLSLYADEDIDSINVCTHTAYSASHKTTSCSTVNLKRNKPLINIGHGSAAGLRRGPDGAGKTNKSRMKRDDLSRLCIVVDGCRSGILNGSSRQTPGLH